MTSELVCFPGFRNRGFIRLCQCWNVHYISKSDRPHSLLIFEFGCFRSHCHKCHAPSHAVCLYKHLFAVKNSKISSLKDILQWAGSGDIVKWRHLGTTGSGFMWDTWKWPMFWWLSNCKPPPALQHQHHICMPGASWHGYPWPSCSYRCNE